MMLLDKRQKSNFGVCGVVKVFESILAEFRVCGAVFHMQVLCGQTNYVLCRVGGVSFVQFTTF